MADDDQPVRRLQERPLLLASSPTAIRVSLGLWIFGGLLFLFIAVPVLEHIVQVLDDAVWHLVVRLEFGVAVVIAKGLDLLGSTGVTAPIMIAVAIYLVVKRRWEAFWFWVLAMAGSQVLIGPMKALYARPRPPLPLAATSNYSFPSGHAVAGTAIAVALVIVLVPAGPRRRAYEILAAAFAFTMALSRVYLRAHWLSDVAAGAALGAAVVIASAAVIHWIDDRRHP
jgi:membrane-associated phospholipid phosphatase